MNGGVNRGLGATQLPVKSGVVRSTGMAVGPLCPSSGGAAPRTQPKLTVLGSTHEGQGDGKSCKEPQGFGWEDPALTGELRPGKGQSQVPKGDMGLQDTLCARLMLGATPHTVKIILAGWVVDPRSQRRQMASEVRWEPDAGLRTWKVTVRFHTQILETRRRENSLPWLQSGKQAEDGGA